MVDRCNRVTGTLDDDLDFGVTNQGLPIITDVRASVGYRIINALGGIFFWRPTYVGEI